MSDTQAQPFNPPVLVGPNGRPARPVKSDRCPQCGEGNDKRETCGFGVPYDVCGKCGHEYEEAR